MWLVGLLKMLYNRIILIINNNIYYKYIKDISNIIPFLKFILE